MPCERNPNFENLKFGKWAVSRGVESAPSLEPD